MFDKIRDYFVMYAKAALDVSAQEKSACESIVTESELVSSFKNFCFFPSHDQNRKTEIFEEKNKVIIYRIMAAMKVETDIITSIIACYEGRD